jgi:large repetitive protein
MKKNFLFLTIPGILIIIAATIFFNNTGEDSRSPVLENSGANQTEKVSSEKSSRKNTDTETSTEIKNPEYVIKGHVKYINGKAASGAKVTLRKLCMGETYCSDEKIAETISDKKGYYNFFPDTTEETGRYFLSAWKDGYAKSSFPVTDCRKKIITRDIVLLRASIIRGRVLNEKDEAIPNVKVTVFSINPPLKILSESVIKTNDNGEFQCNLIPKGEVSLYFDSPGYVSESREIKAPDENIIVHLYSGGAEISGHVFLKKSGEAVTSATVQLEIRGRKLCLGGSGKKILTDDSGYFLFNNLEKGEYILSANKGNLRLLNEVDGSESLIFKVEEKEKKTDLKLILFKGRTLRGKITEKNSGNPLEGVKVFLAWHGGKNIPEDITGPDGKYFLNGIFQSQIHLKLEKEGYASNSKRHDLVVIYKGEKTDEVKDLCMVGTLQISGKVQNEDGERISDAKVFAQKEALSRKKPLAVDKDGSFKIEVVPFTVYNVRAEAPGYPKSLCKVISIKNKSVRDIIITMKDGATIKGIVLDPKGKGVEGASVKAQRNIQIGISSTYEEITSAESGEDGSFILQNLPEGEIIVSAKKEDFCDSKNEKVFLESGMEKQGIKIHLRKSQYAAGKITDSDGVALEGVYVSVHAGYSALNSRGRATTDADGNYRIEGLADMPHTFSLHYKEDGDTHRDVEIGRDDIDFVINKNKIITLTGTVIDWKTKKPISNFTVKCNINSVEIEKDPATPGVFNAKNLKQYHSYIFNIEAPDYLSFNTEKIVPKKENENIKKTFEMGPGSSITGRIIAKKSGMPIPGTNIHLNSVQFKYTFIRKKPEKSITTGEDGVFRFTKVPAGINFLEIIAPGSFPEKIMKVETKHGNESDLGDVELGKGGIIKGRLIQVPGESGVPEKTICLRFFTTKEEKNCITDTKGGFEFLNLAKGNYSLTLKEYNIRRRSIKINEDEEKEVLLKIGEGKLLGTVLKNGRPLTGANISMRKHYYSDYKRAISDENGSFEINQLAPGIWTINIYTSHTWGEGLLTKIEIKADKATEKVFDYPSGEITGIVLNQKEEPVEAARIIISLMSEAASANGTRPRGWFKLTDENGKFTIQDLCPDIYSISASKEKLGGTLIENIAVPENGDPVQVVLHLEKEGGTLISLALNISDGNPLPGAWCNLFTLQGVAFNHSTPRDTEGIMEIPNIPPGTYNAEVSADGFSVHKHTVEIKAGKIAKIEDLLYEAGKLRWVLLDKNDTPLEDVPCRIESMDADSRKLPRDGKTNRNGIWTVKGLRPGLYKVTSTLTDGRQISEEIEIRSGELTIKEMIVK